MSKNIIEFMLNRTVFLLGAGRSGTTLLYKLLCLHQNARYISNFHIRGPLWFPANTVSSVFANYPSLRKWAWFQEKGNAYFMNRPFFRRLIPTPVEGEKVYEKCGFSALPNNNLSLTTDNYTCLKKVFDSYHTSSEQVFINKRTSNNQRISFLANSFGEAKYINLVRDGRAVAYSLNQVEWWNEHILWWAGRTPKEMEAQGYSPLTLSSMNWVKDVRAIQSGLAAIEPDNVLDICFEDLMANPVGVLTQTCQFMGLEVNKELIRVWQNVGLGESSEKWRAAWNDKMLDTVMLEQTSLLAELGYV